MTPAEFFTDSEPEQIVYKANDYFEKIDEEKNSKVEWIIPNAQTRSMEPVRLTLHPGGSSEIYLPQECEEFGYVIKGTVKLCYGGKVHTVKAGESFYFKAGKKHFIENKSSKDAMLIWVSESSKLLTLPPAEALLWGCNYCRPHFQCVQQQIINIQFLPVL